MLELSKDHEWAIHYEAGGQRIVHCLNCGCEALVDSLTNKARCYRDRDGRWLFPDEDAPSCRQPERIIPEGADRSAELAGMPDLREVDLTKQVQEAEDENIMTRCLEEVRDDFDAGILRALQAAAGGAPYKDTPQPADPYASVAAAIFTPEECLTAQRALQKKFDAGNAEILALGGTAVKTTVGPVSPDGSCKCTNEITLPPIKMLDIPVEQVTCIRCGYEFLGRPLGAICPSCNGGAPNGL